MAHQTAVDIIRVISEAVNPTGQFAYLRTWDASLEFNEVDQKIFLYPVSGQVDITNGYFETWTCSMGFFFQDAPDSTNEQREQLITNADVLLKAFILAADTVDGVQFSIVRKRPVYRDMAGTYSGYLVDFTLSLTEDICNGDTPSVIIPVGKTFCELVDECLGISPSGSNTKYLNEKGNWTTPAGGGGGSVVIEATKAEFLALVTANDLTYPATYKITDIDNGLFIEALSENTFATSGTLSLFVPDYNASGVNLGQMDAVTIPTIAANDMVIWGDHYWVNETASPITPTIIDVVTLDGGLTQIVKASGSIYDVIEYPCQTDASLNVISVSSNTGSTWSISSAIANDGGNGSHIYAQLNDAIVVVDNLTSTLNHKGRLEASSPFIQGEVIVNNSAKMTSFFINGNGNEVSGNKSSGEGGYDGINLINVSRFKDNEISGAVTEVAQMGFIELFDNCEMIANKCLGNNSVIWDVRTGENCKFNQNILNSNAVNQGSCGFADVDMMQFDEVIGNELNGDDAVVQVLNMFGYSKFNKNTFNGAMSSGSLGSFCQFQLYNSEITDNTFNQDFMYWREITLHNAKLRNATDIQVQNCTFDDIDLDLTGFTTDIIGQTIQSRKGWFTYKRNLDTSPILTTYTILHNIIPIGERITNLVIRGSANGNSIQIGLSGDDESLLVLPTSLLNNQLITVSNAATANRSLLIKALTDPITIGEITVKCEFVL